MDEGSGHIDDYRVGRLEGCGKTYYILKITNINDKKYKIVKGYK